MKNTPISLSSKLWRQSPVFAILFLLAGIITSCFSEQAEDFYDGRSPMGQGFGINGVTLVVEDLDSSLNYFVDSLGFSRPRAQGPEKGLYADTKSYSMRFPNGSTFDLVAVDDSLAELSTDTLTSLLRAEGVRMYSLSSSSTDSTQSWLTTRGFSMDTISTFTVSNSYPQESSWSRAESKMYKVGFAGQFPPSYYPEFLEMADFPYERMPEWESFYNMQRSFMKQANGVIGITTLKLVVEDLAAVRDEFIKMGFLELEGESTNNLVRFSIKRNQEIQISSPQSPDDELARFLEERGPGLFAVGFEIENLDSTLNFFRGKLPGAAIIHDTLTNSLIITEAYAMGLRLEFKQEPEDQALLAQKLNLNYRGQLDSVATAHASDMYLKYCALCHGENREGYAADNAPSLRSHSLLATAENTNFLRYTIQYGRANTAMAGYYDVEGGPLKFLEIELLLKWLNEMSEMEEPIELSREPVEGDIDLGARLYAEKCASCHGESGEGISAPALGHPMLLATATDHFLRYAIAEGRDGTPMIAFKDSLSDTEIDGITAFLRSRASGWDVPQGDSIKIPTPENYVLNPEGEQPQFELRDGRYLPAVQLNEALANKQRIVLLDARSKVAWRQTHIPGSIPVPYYEEPEVFVEDIPNDSTWVVAYCACPHAASGEVIAKLEDFGFENTAILDEGILVWAQLGYPVQNGN